MLVVHAVNSWIPKHPNFVSLSGATDKAETCLDPELFPGFLFVNRFVPFTTIELTLLRYLSYFKLG